MQHGEPRIKIRFWSHKNKILTTHHHDIHDSIPPTKWKVKAGMNALQNMTTFWWLGESRRNQTSGRWIVIVNKHHMFPWLCVWLSEFKGGKVHAVVCNYLGYTFSIIITYYLFLYNYPSYFETCFQWCKQTKEGCLHPPSGCQFEAQLQHTVKDPGHDTCLGWLTLCSRKCAFHGEIAAK